MSAPVALVLAHGLGGVQDLPLPVWLFYYAGAVVLVVSFVALAVLWRRPLLDDARARPLPPSLQAVLLSRALRTVLQSASFALLVLVFLAALLGARSPTQNLAPTFVWVVFWLGLVPVVLLLGNVWSVLSPWRAAADAVAWAWSRSGRSWQPLEYLTGAGRWPAAALLFAFTALELAYTNPASPRALALAIYAYSAITWVGMAAFGRATWDGNGEAFSVYFSLLARMSPFAVREREPEREREIVVRPPLVGLAGGDPRPGTLAFVAVMLGSVAFDSVSRTVWWTELRASVAADASSALLELLTTAVNTVGLFASVALVALAYLGAVALARLLTGTPRDLVGAFLWSLVPIGLAYTVAHYFSLFLIQGQAAVRLASDPFGWDWDVFGTAAFRPDLAPISPNATWYVQVAALVAGHVLGLVIAHDRAVALFRKASAAALTQYPMLVLMVLYTVGGLWLLANG